MFLACLRGLLPKGPPKQPWRSELRTELILANLSAELDAKFVQASVQMQASLSSALPVDSLKSIVEELQNHLVDAAKMREFDSSPKSRTATGAVTVDGMFKLYQAMIDAGLIKKAGT